MSKRKIGAYETGESSKGKGKHNEDVAAAWGVDEIFMIGIADTNCGRARVPRKFNNSLPHDYVGDVYLHYASKQYKVGLLPFNDGDDEYAAFLPGWKQFRDAVAVQDYDQLIFKHLGKHHFEVFLMRLSVNEDLVFGYDHIVRTMHKTSIKKAIHRVKEEGTSGLCETKVQSTKVGFPNDSYSDGPCQTISNSEDLVMDSSSDSSSSAVNVNCVSCDDFFIHDHPVPFSQPVKGYHKLQVSIPKYFAVKAKLQKRDSVTILYKGRLHQQKRIRVVNGNGSGRRFGRGWPQFFRKFGFHSGEQMTFSLNDEMTTCRKVYINVGRSPLQK